MSNQPKVQVRLKADHLTALFGYTHSYSIFFLDALKKRSQENPTEDNLKQELNIMMAYLKGKRMLDTLLLDLITTSLNSESNPNSRGYLDILFTEPEYNFLRGVLNYGSFNKDALDPSLFTPEQVIRVDGIIKETIEAMSKAKVLSQQELDQIKRENEAIRIQSSQQLLGNTKVGKA